MSDKISKQAYLQQRKRLNPKVFSYLNDKYLEDFYNSPEPKLWNNYLLIAIDGSKAEVPNSQENRNSFGNSGNQHSKEGQVRALVSGMYDILNGFYLDLQIAHISAGENELAKENLNHLEMIGVNQSVLSVFDRGYPSLEFIDFLENKKIDYLFRLSSNDYKEERSNMKSCDEIINIKHNYSRLAKIKKNHPESYKHLKEKENTKARILKSKLPSGQELVLMTDLPEKFSSSEIIDLYYQRWEIEKKYNTLKNKMKFESITGKASIYVYQDFYAQILVYNMIQDIRRNADYNAETLGYQKKMKYPMRTNENIAIGLFKESMIKILLEKDPEIKSRLLSEL